MIKPLIRKCNKEDIPKVIEFFKKNWSPNHIFVKDPNFMKWQLNPKRSEHFTDSGLAALTIWNNDNLEGFQGLIPSSFSVLGKISDGYWLCNLSVSNKFRPHGFGVRLMSEVLKLPVNNIAVSGINNKIFNFYKFMNYHTIDQLNRYICITDIHLMNELAENYIFSDKNTKQLKYNYKFEKNLNLIIKELNFNKNDWDSYSKEICNKNYIGTYRNYDYIKWRYIEHPYFNYKIITIKNDKDIILGHAIYRFEKILNMNIDILRIIEINSLNQNYSKDLISYIENIACNSGVAFIDYFFSQNFTALEKRYGWFKESKKQEFVIPSLFQPLNRNAHYINSAIKIKNLKNYKLSDDLSFSYSIYKSDGDQDRPNLL